MMILKGFMLLFIVLELMNVFTLYFKPESKMGNGIGVFNALEKSKADPEQFALVTYLINWVAGAKLIFIALLLTIVFIGSHLTVQIAAVAMALSIASFFWRLFPQISAMDAKGWITPVGYSKTLFWMILVIVILFLVTLAISIVGELRV